MRPYYGAGHGTRCRSYQFFSKEVVYVGRSILWRQAPDAWVGHPGPDGVGSGASSDRGRRNRGGRHPSHGPRYSDYLDGPMAETLRRLAEERLAWAAPGCLKNPTVQVKILAINDFHGQTTVGKKVAGRPVGSALVLASYLAEAQQGWEGRTIIAEDGNLMGAAPPGVGPAPGRAQHCLF